MSIYASAGVQASQLQATVESASTPDLSQTAAVSNDDMSLAPNVFASCELSDTVPLHACALLSKAALRAHLQAMKQPDGVIVFHDKFFEEVPLSNFWCVTPPSGRVQS